MPIVEHIFVICIPELLLDKGCAGVTQQLSKKILPVVIFQVLEKKITAIK